MTIMNKPSYANDYEYTVARDIDGELWFYGAYNDLAKAETVANQIDGMVVRN